MNRDDLIKAGIDYDDGLNRFCGNAELYEEFLKRMPEDETFKMLDDAMASGDYAAAFDAAHTIKGVVGNLSITGIYNEIVPFVDFLRNGSNIDEAKATYPKFKADYLAAMDMLKNI